MIRPDVINFLIVNAFVILGRYVFNVLAALTRNTPFGQALSLIAA